MSRFDEGDVRHLYDLLQHKPEEDLTQLNAFDGNNLIGVGLFDNEEDFVSECQRYNDLGRIFACVNPRGRHLLDEYGGLKNRMRTLFMDVVDSKDVVGITGVVARHDQLTEAALAYRKDVSELEDGSLFFPLDERMDLEAEQREEIVERVARWFYGVPDDALLMQMVSVPGTAKANSGWWRPRVRFRKYRPYILEGISAAITGEGHG